MRKFIMLDTQPKLTKELLQRKLVLLLNEISIDLTNLKLSRFTGEDGKTIQSKIFENQKELNRLQIQLEMIGANNE